MRIPIIHMFPRRLIVDALLPNTPDSAEITLFKKPNDPNERVNKLNYNPPSFEDFDK